jgi:hypothetical protein
LAAVITTVFLSVAVLYESPSTGLTEYNMGLSTIVIQATDIDCGKASQAVIGSIYDLFDHRL